ncbi:hypothetical protein [Bailinhaonella thermotolerans]|uniref:Alpha amylase inhibitor n=1 Tax=Bailinhaonella thermotolerans TaxID=1070861 RepID=A0A3A4AD45_9ACTN|nr:hypothetical protein [Bailinhaonella thermotolerans]RJL24534.1 hypothetical protein D5H75_29930 [Bailinhaonella thermotolerans]
MNITKPAWLTTSAFLVMASAGLGLASVPAAQAEPARAPAAVTAIARAGNAPSCVAVWHRVGRITKTGYARNDCRRALNLKIVWAHGADGSCRTVAPGVTISHKVPRGIRTFDGASLC